MTTIYRARSAETWQSGMAERPCGSCTMCCKAPGIPEIGKPANQWCQHCEKGSGCRIYERRPQACRDYYCLYKVMPDFPEELRPDKCKVIWRMTEDGTIAIATTEYPKAIQTRQQQRLVQSFQRSGISVSVDSRG